ncbi:hypothetical protein, partial [Brucella daejeonensis]|uniref:hypothetical protein n=1 Tax=Brucella daejeonensis TaxID=659015 RepID=UPI001AEDCF82
PMICSSANRERFIPSASLIATDSTKSWRNFRGSGQSGPPLWQPYYGSALYWARELAIVLGG